MKREYETKIGEAVHYAETNPHAYMVVDQLLKDLRQKEREGLRHSHAQNYRDRLTEAALITIP